jgi:imidazolonepropionase-like amidohydrolase
MVLPLVLQLVAVTHVTVVDVAAGRGLPDMTVVVDRGRIRSVGPSASLATPADARTLDGRGRFLIPGLWDMHVHTDAPSGRAMLALYVANGVTGVRDMAGDWATLQRWRREIDAGTLVGPRIIASGPYLDGRAPPIPHITVRTVADARAAVDSLARLGVDFVKVHSAVPRDAFFEAARRARERHLAIAGHLSSNVTVEEASDAGQRSLEHLLGFANRCTPADSTLFARADVLRRIIFGRCTSLDQTNVYRHLSRNGTWVTPTMTAAYEFAILPERALPTDSLAPYVSDSLRAYLVQIFADTPTDSAVDAALGKRMFAKRLETLGAIARAGVSILAGTDAPMRNATPGFGLHEELSYLVQAGLTPLAALRAATLEPARYFGALDSLGTIAPGKVADLVLVDADPLADIRNARRISAVIARGRVYAGADRVRLLDGVREAARAK